MSAALKKMLNKDFYDISLSTFEKYYEEYKESRSSPIVYWAITKLGWNPFWYQTIMLDSLLKHDKIAWRIGRQTGKTTCLSIAALYVALARPINYSEEKIDYDVATGKMNKRMVTKQRGPKILACSASQDKANVIFDNIFNFMHCNEEIKKAYNAKLITRKRDPYPTYKFPNGAIIDVRGPGDNGDSPRSRTYDYLFIDEADYQPPALWTAVYATTVNTPEFHLLLASTIRGIRGQFFDFCRRNKEIHLPTYVNPNYDKDKDEEYKAMFSPEQYDHEIKAEWSSSSNAVFNVLDLEAARQTYDGYVQIDIDKDYMLDMEKLAETSEDQSKIMKQIKKNLTEKIQCPDRAHSLYYIGCDLGHNNDPSELVVFQRNTRDGKIKLVARLHLSQINYYIQAYIIVLLDMIYKSEMICIDKGAAGIAVYHIIITDDIFKQVRKIYKDKLIPLAYNENIVVGYEEGDKNKPINRQCKQFSTSIISNFLSKREMIYSHSDNELHFQMINHNFVLTENGIRYVKGNDHCVDAVRFAMLALMLSNLKKSKKLPSPVLGKISRMY